MLRRRGARPVHLVELPPEERPPVIAEYLRRGVERSGHKAAEKQARFYFGMSPDPSPEKIRAAAPYYPVFRVVYRGGPGRPARAPGADR